ncbi:MAG: EAL domain-containing protein [Proteobacteria bacterium]|nr:EAL domain-containing protein [Pseudomonadota bacterium]
MIGQKISPTVRLTIGMVSLMASLLLVAQLLGLLPDQTSISLDARKKVVEALATQLSWSASQNDFRTLQVTLGSVVESNDEILSAALRRANEDLVVAAGDHDQYWEVHPEGLSTPTHVFVPLFARDRQWGTVELSFIPLETGFGLTSLRNSVVGLLLFMIVVGGLGIFLLLRRALKELDPSGVIPGRVKGAFDSLAEGVLIMDEKENIVLANAAFATLVEKPVESLIGKKASSLDWRTMRAGDNAENLPWLKAMRQGTSEKGVPLLMHVPSGALKTFRVNGAPINDGDEKTRGVLATFDDVTDIEKKNTDLKRTLQKLEKSTDEINRQNVELRFLATRDPLTGCLNRRAFFERYDQLFDEAKAKNSALSCIMVDIDHFKAVNDNHGHSVGDDVIGFMADVLKIESRDDDLVCRYGGEEFCLVLPGLNMEDAAAVAERLCQTIRETSDAHFKGKVRITISAGVATQTADSFTSMDLVNEADTALYAAKEGGRNRYVCWGDTGVDGRPLPADSDTALTRRIATTIVPPLMTTGAHSLEPVDVQRLHDRIIELEAMADAKALEDQNHGAIDELTGLPNRFLFHDRLSELIKRSDRNGVGFAILYLDLDLYGQVKDTLGSDAGDSLLVTVIERMAVALRNSDIVAYVGGGRQPARLSRLSDEGFGIALTDLKDPESIPWILQRLFSCLDEPVNIDGEEVYASCCIGISVYPTDGEDVKTILRHASIARSHAKERVGQNKFSFYSAEMNHLASQRIHLDAQMRHALEEDQFYVAYQPKMDLRTGQITAMEALIRWQHPDRGLINPNDFIPIAERTGFIVKIGAWVLRAACIQAKEWIDAGAKDIRVAVNVSMVQLASENFIEELVSILEETGVETKNLELEITETAVMEDVEIASRQLQELRSSGVYISIDDFGTGYSSLAYLKSFALDYLKIDSSFVADMERDISDTALIAAVIAMAHRLRLRVVAEGVETMAQLEQLRHLQCDEVQGYLLSKPVSGEEAGAILLSGIPLIAPIEAESVEEQQASGADEEDVDQVLRMNS